MEELQAADAIRLRPRVTLEVVREAAPAKLLSAEQVAEVFGGQDEGQP